MNMDGNSKGTSYPAQLAILSGLTIAGLVLGAIVSFCIWFIMTGETMPMSSAMIMQAKNYNVNMVIQGVSTFFLFFLPVYIFALICYVKPLSYLGFSNSFTKKQFLIVIFILLITFPLSGGLAAFNKWLPIPLKWSTYFTEMENQRTAQEAALIQISSFSKYIISIIGIALLPAVFEETFFRAGIQKLFTKWFKGPYIAIVVTSIVFSLIHLSYYGFLVRFALGVILGLVYYYSGSLWLNIIMHFLFNGIQVTILYVYNNKSVSTKPDIENGFPFWLSVISFFILTYLFIRFVKISAKEKEILEDPIPKDDFDNWVKKNSN